MSPSPANLFFCPLCDKPFSNETTRNRHKPYCRRRRASAKPPRPRACKRCRHGKSRCDFGRPCSSCVSRGVACIYEGLRADKPALLSIPGSAVITALEAQHALIPQSQTSTSNEHNALSPSRNSLTDKTRVLAEPHNESHFGDYSQSEFPDDAIAQFLTPESGLWDFNHDPGTVALSSAVLHKEDSFEAHNNTTSEKNPASILYLSSPLLFPLHNSPCHHSPFLARKVPSSFRRFIASNLRSYPRMMLSVETLPPFVHRQSYELVAGQQRITDSRTDSVSYHEEDSLSNCVSICQLYANKTPMSARMLWRVLDAELNRIKLETSSFTSYEVSAAAQAMQIYIIIRLVESGGDYMMNDYHMFDVMKGLHDRFEQLQLDTLISGTHVGLPSTSVGHGLPTTAAQSTEEEDWASWIMDETRKRMVVVCFLIRLVISPESFDCLADVNLMALPADKTLWEARSVGDFARLRRLRGSTSGVGGDGNLPISVLGDLAAVQRDAVQYGGTSCARAVRQLDEWNTRQDGLGMLVAGTTIVA